MDEDNLSLEEKVVAEFFLASFGKNNLNLKNIFRVNVDMARRHLGRSLFTFIIFLALFFFYVYIMSLTLVFLADEMAPKSVMAKFRRRMLKRTHEEGKSNSLGSVGSEDLKFSLATTKEKNVVESDADVSPTFVDKFELNILAKHFLYQEFMDLVLMTSSSLK